MSVHPRSFQETALKNVLDRIESFHRLPGRCGTGRLCTSSSGPGRAAVVGLDLDQLHPADSADLRQAKKAKLTSVRGKGVDRIRDRGVQLLQGDMPVADHGQLAGGDTGDVLGRLLRADSD
ncbi:hypothetical protein OHA77_39375 [Streptosporangium sp. NBC_01639]|uniref:hypothetical protein n=1 Tax=Streptosporangium sp. NBC_01639 TaxID=2975948 RepID=UPI00386B4377|nr:hypothetical protein OHA77_39375 [Streptosporangium sp. NBC_01639]